MLARLGGALGGLGDLERGLTRALHKTASPAELVTTLRALASVGPALGLQARSQGQQLLLGLISRFDGTVGCVCARCAQNKSRWVPSWRLHCCYAKGRNNILVAHNAVLKMQRVDN